MGAVRLGKNAKLYRGPAGSQASVEMTNVRDLTLNVEKDESDITVRGSGGWEEIAAGNKKGSIDFQMVDKKGDADLTAISTAFFSDTPLAFLILGAALSDDGKGLDADFEILKFSRKEALKDPILYDVSIKPTCVNRHPQWA